VKTIAFLGNFITAAVLFNEFECLIGHVELTV